LFVFVVVAIIRLFGRGEGKETRKKRREKGQNKIMKKKKIMKEKSCPAAEKRRK